MDGQAELEPNVETATGPAIRGAVSETELQDTLDRRMALTTWIVEQGLAAYYAFGVERMATYRSNGKYSITSWGQLTG